ncbi:MAG: CgeB family protein [Cellulosilyticaceae bacterium]
MKEIESSILTINTFDEAEWINGGANSKVHFGEKEIIIEQENAAIGVMAYRDIGGKLRNIKEHDKQCNMYGLSVEMVIEGDLEVEVGISKYYHNNQSETVYYPIQHTISFLSEGIQSIYLTLRYKGSGKLQLQHILVTAKEKVFFNDTGKKEDKVPRFYKWYEEKSASLEEFVPKTTIRIATILDEFSYECFKYEAKLKQLSYSGWQEEMNAFKPEILLVESAWQGKNGSWSNRIARYGIYCDREVLKLIDYCKEKNIPTVFWDKEGLNNFHYFINTASLFDYVGATDENVIEIHQAMRESRKVFILPFAAQPMIHNSIGKGDYLLGNVAFAGSWYGAKYPERIKEMEIILTPALRFGLDIYDRNYDKQSVLSEESWKWPPVYQNAIVGKLPYKAMVEAYKQYKVFLNVQSLNESKWMVPRRVYEILACGTPLVSSYSVGLQTQFGNDVHIAKNQNQTITLLNRILMEDTEVTYQTKQTQQKILKYHTYQNRLETILEKIIY